jgi:hypothetical protein
MHQSHGATGRFSSKARESRPASSTTTWGSIGMPRPHFTCAYKSMHVCLCLCMYACPSVNERVCLSTCTRMLYPHRSMFAYIVTARLKSKTVHDCAPVCTCYSPKPAANSSLHPPPHKISRAPIYTHANLDFFNSVIYIT